MEAKDKIIRARIQIQQKNPFFAYLSLYLNPIETEDLPKYAGMGVDVNGNLYYSKKFVDKLSESEVEAVLIHEVLHLALLHFLRSKNRNLELWNIACDIVTNSLIQKNGFTLPKFCILPNNNEITIWKKKIMKCDEKTAEEIYDELKCFEKDVIVCGDDKSEGSRCGDDESGKGSRKINGRFDNHIGKVSNGLSDDEVRKLEEEWKIKIEEAYISAKLRGNVPFGIEKLIGKLHEGKIEWRGLLNRYIQSFIPYDYSYEKPNKKSISADYYIPDTLKERIDVCVGIDTSGSIGEEELNDFVSEMVSLARTFSQRIKMRIICHDVDVHTDYVVENGNIDKIKRIQIKGGGGTSHLSIFNYIKDKVNCKVAIFLTDGESDIQDIDFKKYNFSKIFVISRSGNDKQLKNKIARVLKLK